MAIQIDDIRVTIVDLAGRTGKASRDLHALVEYHLSDEDDDSVAGGGNLTIPVADLPDTLTIGALRTLVFGKVKAKHPTLIDTGPPRPVA